MAVGRTTSRRGKSLEGVGWKFFKLTKKRGGMTYVTGYRGQKGEVVKIATLFTTLLDILEEEMRLEDAKRSKETVLDNPAQW